jgi:hypothetical protein
MCPLQLGFVADMEHDSGTSLLTATRLGQLLVLASIARNREIGDSMKPEVDDSKPFKLSHSHMEKAPRRTYGTSNCSCANMP